MLISLYPFFRYKFLAGILLSLTSKKIFSFEINEEALESLSHITEAYLVTQLERGFSALDFYKTLLV